MLYFFLIVCALWIGIGSLLLYLKSRAAGTSAFLRHVDKRIYNRTDTINISITLTSPCAISSSLENHDILLVLDHSISMGAAPGSPLRESIRAMENFVQQMPDSYHIGLIIFDHEAQRLCDITAQKENVLNALKTIAPGGTTEIHLALNKCQEALEEGRKGVKKTIILLSDGGSDRQAAEHAAAQLYETATILCVGLGENVDEALMSSIASSPQSYIHVQTAHHLEPLFELLAAVVSGKTASSVLLKEKMNAPHPFTLSKTGDLYPVNIQETATTDVSWFVSLLQEQAAKPVLKYQLQPKCLGWHSVAPEHAEAQWTMPEGQQHTTECGAGPKILVLPTGFAWTGWWLLNPLFWLIFGRFFKCPLSILAHKQKEWDTLPQPDMPKPLLVPDTSFYTPSIKPALVIGLGALGEWSLNRLKWHLQDRQIDEQQVDFLVIQDGSVHNRPAVSIHGCTLSDKERIILQPDLRPYLETLRQDGKAPDARAWIPWRQWLRESRPLTRYTDDRRKARLALLLQPAAVEQRIKENVTRIMQNKGIVLIVINAADAEGTGMLAEVAHMCASYGAGVTAILVPERISSPDTTGLLRELERMLTMRGENILSDRGNTPHSTNKLFDRVIVANQMQANTQNTSEALGHLLWDILAYPEFLAQMPSDRHERCYQIEIQGQTLPQDSLWRWVRDKALSDLINQHWLQTNITANQVELLATNNETVQGYINTFWHYETVLYDRTPSKLLKKSALVIRQGNPLLILKDAIDIPLDQPYHEQKVFCDIERVAFSVYLEAWCYYMLENEGKNNHWGLPTLLEAVTQIQQNFEKLTDTVLRLSGNTALVKQLSFIASIYTDYHVILGGLRSSLERWIAVFVGWQPGMSVNPLPQNFIPVCLEIENQREYSEVTLPFQKIQEILIPLYQDWVAQYGEQLLQQLNFQITSETQTHKLSLHLQCFDTQLGHSDTLLDVFRKQLDQYKELIFQWPTQEWVTPQTIQNPANALRMGQFSQQAYHSVTQAIHTDDPFMSSAFSIQASNLEQIFSLPQNSPAIYAWAEEANAQRISDKIRYLLQQEPALLSAKVVSLMHHTKQLHGFMSALAHKHITLKGQKIFLHRDDKDFEIGPNNPTASDIDKFEDMIHQVVSLGISLNNERLPLFVGDWIISPKEAVILVENNPLVPKTSSHWEMWQHVIMGLALEYTNDL